METMNTLKPSWNTEDYSDYLRLRDDEKKRLDRAKSDYNKFYFRVNEDLMKDVPESKREEVLTNAKLETMNKNITFAHEMLVRLNEPLKDQVILKLKMDYRNFNRQLGLQQARLGLHEDGIEVKDRNGVKIESFETKMLIDQLKIGLFQMEKDLKLYGLDPLGVLKNDILS